MKSVSAGKVAAGPTAYVVTECHDHPSLMVGDIVRMTEDLRTNMFLIRDDFTAHDLQDGCGQYVHLAEAKRVDTEPMPHDVHGVQL